MAYFETANVRVFPSALRIENASGKFTTESNFTNIIKSICELDSFVIGYTNNILEVVIDGYYFAITMPSLPENLWLYINVPTATNLLSSLEADVTVLDDGGNFTGISTTSSIYSTASLQVTDNNGNLMNQAWLKALRNKDGNWINFNDYLLDNLLINPSKIDLTKLKELIIGWTDFVVYGAKYLYNDDGTTKISVGGYNNKVNTTIKFENGRPVESVKITYSTSAPAAPGNEGDIWFVYKG